MLEKDNVYLGDCLELMNDIKDKSIDMILCDLPYGTTSAKWDNIVPFKTLWEHYERIIKDNGAIVLFGSQPFTTDLISSNRKLFKYCWVWNKEKCGNPLNAKYQPMISHEDICVFGKKKINYYPIMEERGTNRVRTHVTKRKGGILGEIGELKVSENHNEKLRYPKSILTFKRNWRPQDQLHSTQKPVELLEYLIRTYTTEEALILDNCMGSGSTIVACKNVGNRHWIGIEKDLEIYKVAYNRINGYIYDDVTQL